MSVAPVRSGIVIRSVMISRPVARITRAGMVCPASTNGFFGTRSAMTPPMGATANMPMPEPIWARPAAALLPEMSKATLGTSMNDIMKAVVASNDPDHSIL